MVDYSENLTYLPIYEESHIVVEAVADKALPTYDEYACQNITDEIHESLQYSVLSENDQQIDKSLADSLLEQMLELTPAVCDKLIEEDIGDVMLRFYKQVKSGCFPLQNIAFLLWSDVVKWFDCPNTCSMIYSEDSKKFWKLGWRLFGGQFINFMSGFKNES